MAIDYQNVQGNITPGFNTRFQVFLALRRAPGGDLAAAAAWLASLANKVTTAQQVTEERPAIRSASRSAGMTWLCAALGRDLLDAIRGDAIYTDVAFNNGFAARAKGVMGDRTEPQTWQVGGPDTPVDVLLIIAGNDKTATEQRADRLEDEARAADLVRSYRELGIRLDNEEEHFGFRDGVSQPRLDRPNEPGDTPAGQVLFGYAGRDQRIRSALWRNEPEALSRDGSMMVFRRLEQDVAAFRDFVAEAVAELLPRWPDLREEHLAALLVGRWKDGQLVDTRHDQPDGSGVSNDFDFHDDREGLGCPIGAHMRKVNPRAGGDEQAPERRAFVRRGIPFGPRYEDAPEAKRGLLFVAFQTSINDQTDFVTQTWMNHLTRPGIAADLLVGRNNDPARVLTLKRGGQSFEVRSATNQWVNPTGGAYLFAPGIAGLRELGLTPVPPNTS